MKIQSIKHTVSPKYRQKESNKTVTVNPKCNNQALFAFHQNNISFKSALNYHDFLTSIAKVYKNKSLKNVILSTIKDKKNYIGSGFCADAYNLPGVDNYIIRVERKDFSVQSFIQNPVTEEVQNSLAPNFGQFVASNGHGFFINKKVFGTSHSLPNWAEKINALEYGEELSHSDAKVFLNKILQIADYPQKSFEELAQKIKKLNKYTESEIDIINPNNLIVNDENKTFGIIDLWYKHKPIGEPQPYNGTDSMINLMLDPFMHKRAYEKLSNTDKEKLKNSSEEIINKALKAGNNAGLDRTSDYAMSIYRDLDKKLPDNFAQKSYANFLSMYKNLLQA